jgi:hypothetical protein
VMACRRQSGTEGRKEQRHQSETGNSGQRESTLTRNE